MAGTKLTRRTMLGALAAAPFARPARAQAAWPTKPVRVMVPYPPAGGADTTGRIVFGKLGEALGQQFVVENRGGAGGTIGEAVVAKAEPDGYTVLHDATAFSVNSSLYSNLSFDYNKDFDPGRAGVAGAEYPGGDAVGAGEDGGRRHRLRQGRARRHRHGLVRQWHIAASFARNVPACHRHQDQPRALPWRRSRAQRCDGRAGEILLRQWLVRGRADQGRQGEGDRAYRQRPPQQPAGYPAGVGYPAGLRSL